MTGRVALIGLGRMGRPMAARLAGAGIALSACDADPAARDAVGVLGVEVQAAPAAAAKGAEILITMLPDGAIVRDVLLKQGVVGALEDGALVIDMSSSAPMGTRQLGAVLAGHGIGMLDAPVSGGVARARDGTLTAMVGGEAAALDRARPALEAMASQVIHCGALGAGHAVKALNNYVSAAGLSAACEALLVAQDFGIDLETLVDVLNVSTGRNNSTEVKLKPHVLTGSFASGFALSLMAKDLRTAADLGQALGHPRPGIDGQASLWAQALERLGQGADHTEIYRYLEQT